MSELLEVEGLREGEQVEFKRQWTDKALEDLAAFANTRGGNLFVGVADSGDVLGMAGTDKEMQAISSKIYEMLGMTPRMEWKGTGTGERVLVICVEPHARLVSLRGHYFVRMGSTNREMLQDEFTRRLLQNMGSSWDALASSEGTEAIDPEAILRFEQLAKGRLPYLDGGQPMETILDKLGLLKGDRVVNGALLLFGREPQRYFRSALVKIARVQDGELLSSHETRGTLFEQLDEIFQLMRNLYVEVRFEIPSGGRGVEGTQRQEIWEYPYQALREAVINALVHREYTIAGDIQIRVYEDRLEIWNPGPLLSDLDPALLRIDPHPSRRRNEIVAEIFYTSGLIERWGTGTVRMIKACREQDLPEPEFVNNEGGGFKVVFRKDRFSPEQLKRMELNDRQIQAVVFLKEGGSISNSEYQDLTGAEKRTSSRDLTDLVDRGILERVGATGHGTKYRLKR